VATDAAPTRVTVAFEDGTVTLLLRRAPVGNSAPIRGETLAAFPLGHRTYDALAEQITRVAGRPLPPVPAVLDSGEAGEQPSLAVLGLTEAEARDIGVALGLAAVFYWDGRRAGHLTCAPAT
jgi:hypothetical protein